MEPRLDDVVTDSTPSERRAEAVLRIAILEARRGRLSREAAEDVGQTVVLRYLPRAGEIRDPVAWSRFVARNLVVWHRELADRAVPWTDWLSRAASPSIELERRWRLENVLRALGERDQRLLTMALAGSSHGEIARQFAVAERDVGTMLRRATRRAVAARLALEPSA